MSRRGPLEASPSAQTHSSGGSDVPLGIVVLAVLNVLGALLALVPIGRLFALSDPVATGAGVFLLLFAGAGLVVTYGLVTLQYWGWFGTAAFTVEGLVLSLASFDVLGLLIRGLVLYYLFSKKHLYES